MQFIYKCIQILFWFFDVTLSVKQYCCDSIHFLCSPTTRVNCQLEAIQYISVSLKIKSRKKNCFPFIKHIFLKLLFLLRIPNRKKKSISGDSLLLAAFFIENIWHCEKNIKGFSFWWMVLIYILYHLVAAWPWASHVLIYKMGVIIFTS